MNIDHPNTEHPSTDQLNTDGLGEVTRSLLHDWELSPLSRIAHDGIGVALRVRRRGVTGQAGVAVLRHTDPAAAVPDSTEHIVLRRWAGAGAVRLLAADPARAALLVEDPVPGTDLSSVDLIEGCEVLGGLLPSLAVPAPAQLRTVASVLASLPAELHRASDVLPRRFLEEAVSLARSLADDDTPDRVVPIALDFRSVVAAHREPHLATSGLALAGDPAYAVAAAVWDRSADAARAYRLRAHLRLRIEVVCDVAGIDAVRARAFTVVRTCARIAAAAARGAASTDEVTTAIGIVKAMQG
ncbi:MAG: aminoglycoside phosphotransferase family protein [Nakamurella sp.]